MSSHILHRFFLKHVLLSFCLLILSVMDFKLTAQQAAPKSLKIYPELEGHWFLDGQLKFGCEVTYSNGGKRRSAGYLQGNVLWSEFICSSDQAIFDRDVCLVDLSAVARNGNALVIHVAMVDNPQVKTSFTIKPPPVKELRVGLSDGSRIRYGRVIEPIITVEYSNGLRYSFLPGDAESLIAADSVELFFNKDKIHIGSFRLPEYSSEMERRFTLTAVWKSKPWLNDMASFVYDGRDDVLIRLDGIPGNEGKSQQKAPRAMDGAEGYYGFSGGDGPPVEIIMRYDSLNNKLSLDVTSATKKVHKVLDAREASVTLIARGGRGGNGGRGGEGGDATLIEPYAAGIGGNGGVGGQGGKGSSIVIRTTKSAERFLPCLMIDNTGGDGGKGGKGGLGGKFSNGMGAPTFLDLLFPSRNYPGNQGASGSEGASGGEPEIIIID